MLSHQGNPTVAHEQREFDNPGGRPPEEMPAIDQTSVRERQASPSPLDSDRFSKKGHNEVPEIMHGTASDMDAEGELQSVSGDELLQKTGSRTADAVLIDPANPGKESYVIKLLGAQKIGGIGDSSKSFSDAEIIILDDDVLLDRSGAIPSIQFSNRVHDQVDRNMRNAIIVRLLGRSTGYRSLLSRIQSLWKHVGELQLIDLDNSYYLIRFSALEDYNKVIVWVRLPGLPYRYYTKAIFRHIASFIGKVVKIDYNTDAGDRGKFARLAILVDLNKPLLSCIRIDGTIQKIEYEGLHNICFSCGVYGHSKDVCESGKGSSGTGSGVAAVSASLEKAKSVESISAANLFGPWMVVDNRRRRSGMVRNPVGIGIGGSSVSRFEVLHNVVENNDVEGEGNVLSVVSNPVGKAKSKKSGNQTPAVVPLVDGHAVQFSERTSGSSLGQHRADILELNRRGGRIGKKSGSIVTTKMSPLELVKHLSDDITRAGQLGHGLSNPISKEPDGNSVLIPSSDENDETGLGVYHSDMDMGDNTPEERGRDGF
ncbi:hypothetical protein GQ457_01G006790 [Hibiscus cannabinus]